MPWSDQTDRQRQLDIAVSAVIAIDEVLQGKWNIALIQIAAPAQLLSDIGGHVLRLFFSDVEGDHANRVLILACQQVENDGFGPASQWEMMMVETSGSAKMPAKGVVKKHTRLKTILGGVDRLDKAQQGIRGVHGGEKARDEEKGGQEI